MPDKGWNLKHWGNLHKWEKNGDEFSEFATEENQDYTEWKSALVAEVMMPSMHAGQNILEIGAGRGRWSAILAPIAAKLHLTDLCESNINFLKKRFSTHSNIEYICTDSKLHGIPDSSVDFIWSFDVFVHVELSDIQPYAPELRRVLKQGGSCILHHADGSRPNSGEQGARTCMAKESLYTMFRNHGLTLAAVRDSWGPGGIFSVRRYGDAISTFSVNNR